MIFPPIHIKLGLMKQILKAQDKEGKFIKDLRAAFPSLSEETVKQGKFDRLHISKMKDVHVTQMIVATEKKAWCAFNNKVKNFLGNNMSENYVELVDEVLAKYRDLLCNVSIKLHFLFSNNFKRIFVQ